MDPKNILREISPEMLSKHKENAKGAQKLSTLLNKMITE